VRRTTEALAFEPVLAEDFDVLFTLRMAAMQESLARLGLGDRQRSLERFTGQFEPEWMRWILKNGERIGFTKLKPSGNHLHIDHLFIRPGAQGGAVGAWVLDWAKGVARAQRQDLTLRALKLSDANRYYQRHGFEQVGEGELEIEYRWKAGADDFPEL